MEQNKDQSGAAVRGEAVAHPAFDRGILYTDIIQGEQVRRDDLWAITTAELKALLSVNAIEFRFKVSQARTVRLESTAPAAPAAPMVAEPVGEGQAQTSAAFPLMRAAFETSESGPDGYFIKFKFPTLVAMQKAHIEWIAAQLADSTTLAAPMVADPAGAIPFWRSRNVPGNVYPLQELMQQEINALRDLLATIRPTSAATVVADPAGVAVSDNSETWNEISKQVQAELQPVVDIFAATVKAVPSEALDADAIRNDALEDAAKMLLNGYFLHDAAPRKLFAGEAAKAIREMKLAAPVADKTGGGE